MKRIVVTLVALGLCISSTQVVPMTAVVSQRGGGQDTFEPREVLIGRSQPKITLDPRVKAQMQSAKIINQVLAKFNDLFRRLNDPVYGTTITEAYNAQYITPQDKEKVDKAKEEVKEIQENIERKKIYSESVVIEEEKESEFTEVIQQKIEKIEAELQEIEEKIPTSLFGRAKRWVQMNPGKATLIGVGAGLVGGYLAHKYKLPEKGWRAGKTGAGFGWKGTKAGAGFAGRGIVGGARLAGRGVAGGARLAGRGIVGGARLAGRGVVGAGRGIAGGAKLTGRGIVESARLAGRGVTSGAGLGWRGIKGLAGGAWGLTKDSAGLGWRGLKGVASFPRRLATSPEQYQARVQQIEQLGGQVTATQEQLAQEQARQAALREQYAQEQAERARLQEQYEQQKTQSIQSKEELEAYKALPFWRKILGN